MPGKRSRRRETPAEEPVVDIVEIADEEDDVEFWELAEASSAKKAKTTVPDRIKATSRKSGNKAADLDCQFVGEPVPVSEAKKRWPERYDKKGSEKGAKSENDEALFAKKHYLQAKIDGCVFNLNESAYIKAEDGHPDHIGKIIEFFVATDCKPYFTAQWFFKAEDTVIKDAGQHDPRRVFISNLRDVNPLDCIVSKITILQVDLDVNDKGVPPCDFYYNMSYAVEFSTFLSLTAESSKSCSDLSSSISSDVSDSGAIVDERSYVEECSSACGVMEPEATCLDLYSGCGGMSTGLCLGANLAGVKLVTRWAVDLNPYACESLKINHPQTEVRNESVDDFLALLKEWKLLCEQYSVLGAKKSQLKKVESSVEVEDEEEDEDGISEEEFVVEKLLAVSYGELPDSTKHGLKFKVRWKGYGPEEDTWEPIDGLSNCQERIEDFVINGYKLGILPLPGNVDIICGGPPCQGISGFNRFRNKEAPLQDPKNKQMVVFMDVVDYLKPKYVLMENVVDILLFAGGFLGRYALSRLIQNNYQARMGMMAAGCYGLPQFRSRVFLWGARPTEKLPQYPLPTHDVVGRGRGAPVEFENNLVAYDEKKTCNLEKALVLGDAISDLPSITNDEIRDEMSYQNPPKTEFQRYIRSIRHGTVLQTSTAETLFDHRPLKLSPDDYERVCHIPHEKGANFRNLPGVMIDSDNVVHWDPEIERVLLTSGKPLVPDYAMSFVKGKSKKPFGRLWWDETVPTVVTRAEPHNQVILHPEQNRVLSIRENARLQGFPDFYKLVGPVKERYIQVGNAVAVPVSRALGYAMGMSFQKKGGEKPVMTLPKKFPSFEQGSSSIEVD